VLVITTLLVTFTVSAFQDTVSVIFPPTLICVAKTKFGESRNKKTPAITLKRVDFFS
jgi:hypothetical protein